MAYVYMLSDYEEHGATNVHATLNRASLPSLLEKGWNCQPELPVEEWQTLRWEKAMTEDREALAKLMERDDAELATWDGYNLSHGWGGVMLHVVELTE